MEQSYFFLQMGRPFAVQIESLAAGGPTVRPTAGQKAVASVVPLASFDGADKHTWHSEDDPVMGGLSSSSFEVKENYGDYSGTCRIVPKLSAPGFTIALTESPLLASFPDVSAADGILLSLRRVGGNVSSFKFAFCTLRVPFLCQFKSYKADFEILQPTKDFEEVFLPWSAFSDKWSPSTGKHTEEEPPTAASLRSVTQLQLWTEGVAGDFHLQLKAVSAATKPATLIV